MVSFLLIILTALFFPGIIIRTKSLMSGRKGPGIFQPWKDIWLLLRKGSVFSRTTSLIFQMAPAISLATVICAMATVPLPFLGACLSFEGDFIFFAYILAFGKFWAIIGALDTGSSFEGMGANREALYSMLAEPAFFVLLGTLSMLSGATSFADLFTEINDANLYYYLVAGIGIYLFIQVAMIENSRLPIDDPKTHLELTMVHEVMVLDNSGFDMALIHITSALKFGLYGTIIANLAIPPQIPIASYITLFFIIQFAFAIIVGLLESFRARYQMKKNPIFIFSLTSIALICFVLVLILTRKFIN
jgi:formate hydrogenlyase subunit 4